MSIRILDIVGGTSVDGPGLRTSIYFAGCAHHCQGCHNPQSWDPEGGNIMDIDEIMAVIKENDFNVTFSGGDPFFQAEKLIPLAKEIKKVGKTLWCYTGYLYEHIVANSDLNGLLEYVDVLVDGPFVENLRDISLLFRGSSNQRLIDVKASRQGDIVPYEPYC